MASDDDDKRDDALCDQTLFSFLNRTLKDEDDSTINPSNTYHEEIFVLAKMYVDLVRQIAQVIASNSNSNSNSNSPGGDAITYIQIEKYVRAFLGNIKQRVKDDQLYKYIKKRQNEPEFSHATLTRLFSLGDSPPTDRDGIDMKVLFNVVLGRLRTEEFAGEKIKEQDFIFSNYAIASPNVLHSLETPVRYIKLCKVQPSYTNGDMRATKVDGGILAKIKDAVMPFGTPHIPLFVASTPITAITFQYSGEKYQIARIPTYCTIIMAATENLPNFDTLVQALVKLQKEYLESGPEKKMEALQTIQKSLGEVSDIVSKHTKDVHASDKEMMAANVAMNRAIHEQFHKHFQTNMPLPAGATKRTALEIVKFLLETIDDLKRRGATVSEDQARSIGEHRSKIQKALEIHGSSQIEKFLEKMATDEFSLRMLFESKMLTWEITDELTSVVLVNMGIFGDDITTDSDKNIKALIESDSGMIVVINGSESYRAKVKLINDTLENLFQNYTDLKVVLSRTAGGVSNLDDLVVSLAHEADVQTLFLFSRYFVEKLMDKMTTTQHSTSTE